MQIIPNGTNTFGTANTCFYGTRASTSQGIYNETTTVRTDSGITFAANDVLQMAYDSTTGKVWFGKNNAWFDWKTGRLK